MRVLHFYPDKNSMVMEYIDMLRRAMGDYAETEIVRNLSDLKKQVKSQKPDIVHLHGCWNPALASAAYLSRKKGIRYVLNSHGQLESWIISQNYWRDKLPKIIAFQRRTVRNAYSVIAMGKMEAGCISRLGWNKHIEIVHNPLITSTVTEQDAGLAVYSVYRKVLDSDVFKLMKDDTVTALRALIKAGQTRDGRWLNATEQSAVKELDTAEWRKLLIYSYHEKISETIQSGITAMNMPVPDLVPQNIPVYLPTRAQTNKALSQGHTGDINTDAAAMLKTARKRIIDKTLTISNLLELSHILRDPGIEDTRIANTLEATGLMKPAGRLMQVLSDMTGLDQGFMPVPAKKDRHIKKIKRIIIKHLEI